MKLKPRVAPYTRLDYQINAPQELEMISRPPSSVGDPGNYFKEDLGYFYYEEAGEGVTVYVVDTGANTNNPVSTL